MNNAFATNKKVVIRLLEQTKFIARNRKKDDIAADLTAEVEHLNRGRLCVLICGECKRGKSSLIEAFLGEQNLCPADVEVATNTFSIIQYGEKERVLVTVEDEKGTRAQKTIERAEIRSYVTEQQNKNNYRRVRQIDAEIPNARLKEGLVLVDTPGIGGMNPEHTAITYGLVPVSDIIVFVGDAQNPLGKPELEFCGRFTNPAHRFLHVLTKRDLVDNYADVLRNNVAILAETFKLPGTSIAAVAVSAKTKVVADTQQKAHLLEASGFPEFEEKMWALLQAGGDILLSRALDSLVRSIAQLRLPLAVEHDALTNESMEALDKIDAELKKREYRSKELQAESAFWMEDLSQAISGLHWKTQAAVMEQIECIRDLLKSNYLDNRHYIEHPTSLHDMLTADIENAYVSVLGNIISPAINEIVEDLTQKTSLDIEGFDISFNGPKNLAPVAFTQISRYQPVRTGMDKAIYIGRSGLMAGGAIGTLVALGGGAVGGVIGFFAGGPVGALIGAKGGMALGATAGSLVGTSFGTWKGARELQTIPHTEIRHALESHYGHELSKIAQGMLKEYQRILAEAQAGIRRDLMRKIAQESNACGEAVKVLQVARMRDHAQTRERVQIVAKEIEFLDGVAADAGKMLPTLFSQGSPAPADQ